MGMRLVIRGLGKSYPGRPVFKDIGAEADEGEILIVAGPNGSGKSTLIRIICGFVRPTSGQAYLEMDKRKLQRLAVRPFAGLVSPDLVLYDELSALENLGFFAKVSGVSISKERLEDNLEKVGLGGRGDDKTGSYSSGMKQRLKYCLALLRNPPLLLLDEPMSNLDDRGKELVDGIIRSHEGILVIATNERSELEYGTRIIRLDQ